MVKYIAFFPTTGYTERAIELDPNDADAYRKKAAALVMINCFEEALVACEHSIQLNPDIASTYRLKEIALLCLNREDEALAANEQTIELVPNFAND